MMHYLCTGDCGAESEHPGVCETAGCSKEGDPLIECDCDNGLHKGVVEASDEPDVESMDDEDGF